MSAVELFEAISEQPGLRCPQLANLLGMPRSRAAGAIAKLRTRGLVRFLGPPRSGGYYSMVES